MYKAIAKGGERRKERGLLGDFRRKVLQWHTVIQKMDRMRRLYFRKPPSNKAASA